MYLFIVYGKKERAGKNGYKYKNILNPNENFALASIYWISKDFNLQRAKQNTDCHIENAIDVLQVHYFIS